MKKKNVARGDDDKAFHFRMPKETWVLLKNVSVIKECTMGEIIVQCLEKNRKRWEAKL